MYHGKKIICELLGHIPQIAVTYLIIGSHFHPYPVGILGVDFPDYQGIGGKAGLVMAQYGGKPSYYSMFLPMPDTSDYFLLA
jgi:hypothetical protein